MIRITMNGETKSLRRWALDFGVPYLTAYSRYCDGRSLEEVFEARDMRVSHGHSRRGKKTKTYDCWRNMISRCTNPDNKSFCDYGGRGIVVCERWLRYENFLADMGEAPDDLSIDRIDNSKGYSKENCRWATKTEQSNNTRRSTLLTHDGKTQSISAWSRETGVPKTTIRHRLIRGLSIEEALTMDAWKRIKNTEREVLDLGNVRGGKTWGGSY